ncbi:MAG: germination protein YpeB [Oscillospiraceae bacterium]|nr:germination protein YpeB [Oscillospiraceae bacterium]
MNQPFSRRGHIRTLTFLTAALLVACISVIRLAARNLNYQRALGMSYARAFSALADSVEKMDTSLEKSIYVTSPELIAQLCTEIYGESRTARQAVGELPYGNIELEQTAALVARVGDYAQAVGKSAARNGGYSGEEQKNIQALRKLTANLAAELDELEARLNEGNLTLDDAQTVERRLSHLTEEGNVLAGSSYESLESDFPELPTLVYDGPFSDHLQSRQRAMLEGEAPVTLAEAKKAAAEFFHLSKDTLQAGYELDGEIPCWCFSSGDEFSVCVTKQGGYILQFTNGREIDAATMTHEEGVKAAKRYLAAHSITDMKESYFIDRGNRLTVNFASVQDEVVCYPDLIKVEVALDNGEIIGFESEGYLTNHTKRTLSPTVEKETAQQQVSNQLHVVSSQLALVPTEGKNEVLCWEFRCENGDGRNYLAYINAETGKEQQLLILLEDESGTLTM